MSSVFFVAVQCCQCSTMQAHLSLFLSLWVSSLISKPTIKYSIFQIFWLFHFQVKQRNEKSKKSSSNKWTCVVCNQKQSVRKVFAQGPMAKHLRSFVQSSNISRQSPQQFTIDDDDDDDRNSQTTKKPRTDWTDYLDRPNDDSHTNNNIDEEENDGK